MTTVDKRTKYICKEYNCSNYRFPYEDEYADFCTLHNVLLKCSVNGCSQFKTSILSNTDINGEFCYMHTGQRVMINLIKNEVHGYAHLDPERYNQVTYIPTKPSVIDRAKEHLIHGTRMMYKTGCSCDSCKEANNKYEQARRQRHELRLHHLPIPQELEKELSWLYSGMDLESGLDEEQDAESTVAGPPGTGAQRGSSGHPAPVGDLDLEHLFDTDAT